MPYTLLEVPAANVCCCKGITEPKYGDGAVRLYLIVGPSFNELENILGCKYVYLFTVRSATIWQSRFYLSFILIFIFRPDRPTVRAAWRLGQIA